jgi:thioesterase DpgC
MTSNVPVVEPTIQYTDGIEADAAKLAGFAATQSATLNTLPEPAARDEHAARQAAVCHEALGDARGAFLDRHGEAVYAVLTAGFTRFLRADALLAAADAQFPGLVPSGQNLIADAARKLKDKEGFERDQGRFFACMLARPRIGTHLISAMLRPLPRSEALVGDFVRDGFVDLGTAEVRRVGLAAHVVLKNPSVLNAEDDTTVGPVECAVDIALLDPKSQVCVLRGGPVTHARYHARGAFCTGINLTRLYAGQISYLWAIDRELGFIHKILRGLALTDTALDEPESPHEKPWVAAINSFAIGGGCQYLLATDHVIAEADAYLTLPARKEGILPGAANLRLPRFIGDRLARQAILFDRPIPADSPEGRLICDTLVPPGELDAGIEQAVATLTSAGPVGVIANRRALRAGAESVEDFRRYMATYARDQAACYFSPALIRNLEENWLKPKGLL